MYVSVTQVFIGVVIAATDDTTGTVVLVAASVIMIGLGSLFTASAVIGSLVVVPAISAVLTCAHVLTSLTM